MLCPSPLGRGEGSLLLLCLSSPFISSAKLLILGLSCSSSPDLCPRSCFHLVLEQQFCRSWACGELCLMTVPSFPPAAACREGESCPLLLLFCPP